MSFSRTHLIPPVPQILTVYKLLIKVVQIDYQFPHLQKSHARLSIQTQDCCHLRYRWSEYRQPRARMKTLAQPKKLQQRRRRQNSENERIAGT